jgi:glutathione S-transferase
MAGSILEMLALKKGPPPSKAPDAAEGRRAATRATVEAMSFTATIILPVYHERSAAG